MQVQSLWRHPIKSHGREAVERVELRAGQSMPFDRLWAVAHEAARTDGTSWAQCVNFSRAAKAPQLMAIEASLDETTEMLTLRHPNRPEVSLHPERDAAALIAWVMPLVPQERALPERVVRLNGRGWTDSDFPSVTLCNMASHRAVEQRLGRELSIHRWRGNIWFDGPVWEEFDWMDRDVRIGGAVLRVRERTDRCLATTTNPDTGQRDADTLGALESWGHQDFSVRAEVIDGGAVAVGDPIEVL